MKVLMVVEDEADIRMLIRLRLRMEPDLEVHSEASDVSTAIRYAAESPPDLIILDHQLLGGVSGMEGAPLLKQASPERRSSSSPRAKSCASLRKNSRRSTPSS